MTGYNLNRLAYFVAVADEGTITAAAARLAVSKTVVSKQVQLLESELGVSLMVRNTRHLYLTEAGKLLHERARALLAEADATFEEVASGAGVPRGTLRMTAPLGFGTQQVMAAVAQFSRQCPEVRVEVNLSDQSFDVVEAGLDLAIHVGWLRESGHKAKKLCDFHEIAVASPQFLARHGTPLTPEDLLDLPFIENRVLTTANQWTFIDEEQQPHQVILDTRVSLDATPAIVSAVLQGVGFAIQPDFSVQALIGRGELVRLLPNYSLRTGGVYLIFPNQRFRSAALSAFIAVLESRVPLFRGP